jgi:hypothetical protein
MEHNKKCDSSRYSIWLENLTDGYTKILFLNSDKKEEVYMKQLEGFIKSRFKHLISRFDKTFYGLCQAL